MIEQQQENRVQPASNNTFVRTLLGLLPLFILISGVVAAISMKFLTPDAKRRPAIQAAAITVNVLPIEEQDYQVVVESYGSVQPQTESMLVAQVSGQIMSISPSLRDGGFFEKGDELLSIDNRDYAANVQIAEAALINAKQQLAEELARSDQALADWERLGNNGEAPDLVLRKPQLSAAQARVASAESSLQLAKLNLQRTSIKAPFAGRVLRQSVDIGQVVGMNAPIAQIYATDHVEVRLPLRDRDLAFVDLPEDYRHSDGDKRLARPVTLYSSLVKDSPWNGNIVRTESAIDESARQLHCVAQIDDPFGDLAVGRVPLKIGEYVTARIQGRTINSAIVVPVSAIYQSTYAYIVQDNRLQQRRVQIAWQNDKEAIIAEGIDSGDDLVITPLGQVTSGLEVIIQTDDRPSRTADRNSNAAPPSGEEPSTKPSARPASSTQATSP